MVLIQTSDIITIIFAKAITDECSFYEILN